MKQINITNSISLTDEVTKHKLSLRKTTLNNSLLNKRNIPISCAPPPPPLDDESLSINLSTLQLPSHLQNKSFSSLLSAVRYINSLLNSNNINEIKYAIIFIKNNITDQYLIELKQSNTMCSLLQCLCEHNHDIQIVYETLSCLYTLMFHYNDNYFLEEIISEQTMNALRCVMTYNNIHIISLIFSLFKDIYTNDYITSYQRGSFISSELFQQDMLTYVTNFITQHEHIRNEELFISNVIALYSTIIVYNKQHKIKMKKTTSLHLMQTLIECSKYSDSNYERIYLILSALKESDSNTFEQSVPLVAKSVLFTNTLNGVYNSIPKVKYLISYVLAGVYHYLNVNNVIDNDMLDNIVRYEVKNIKEINDDVLKSDLYWRVSFLINKNELIIHRVVHNNEFMNEIERCVVHESKWDVLKTCFKCLKAMIKHGNEKDVKLIIIEMNLFDKVISNVLDKINDLDLAYYVLETVYHCLKRWERFNDNENQRNFLLNKFITHGGTDLIEKYSQTKDLKLVKVLHKLIIEFQLMNNNEMDIDEVCSINNVIKI